MAQTNINIKMDKDLKEQFEEFCSNMGMTMTTAFCAFAKAVVRERRIPFMIEADLPEEEIDPNDPFYSPENMEILRKAIAELKAGKGKVHELIEVDDEDE